MGRKQIRELEDSLIATTAALPSESGEDKHHFFTEMYPGLQWYYEQAKADVAKLGMREMVEAAIRDCMVLVKQGRRKAAQDLLFEACGALRAKSGTFDEMRRMYTASNDPKVA